MVKRTTRVRAALCVCATGAVIAIFCVTRLAPLMYPNSGRNARFPASSKSTSVTIVSATTCLG
jgi:hypothetical protein